MDTKLVSLMNSGTTNPVSVRSLATSNPATEVEAATRTDRAASDKDTEASKRSTPVESSESAVKDTSLDSVVAKLNQHVQKVARSLVFSIDERHGKPIVTVIDKETDTIIRQIPSEVALQVADALDGASGGLVSEHA